MEPFLAFNRLTYESHQIGGNYERIKMDIVEELFKRLRKEKDTFVEDLFRNLPIGDEMDQEFMKRQERLIREYVERMKRERII